MYDGATRRDSSSLIHVGENRNQLSRKFESKTFLLPRIGADEIPSGFPASTMAGPEPHGLHTNYVPLDRGFEGGINENSSSSVSVN